MVQRGSRTIFLALAALIVAIGGLTSYAYHQHIVTVANADRTKALADRQRQQVWEEHQKREAYNRAHPEELAARKKRAYQLERARQLAVEQQRQRVADANSDYPYVATNDKTDLWYSNGAMCNDLRIAAQAIIAGTKNTPEVDYAMIGRSDLNHGVEVAVEGHATWQCPGADTTFNMTRIRTVDGTEGYIQEGTLSKHRAF